MRRPITLVTLGIHMNAGEVRTFSREITDVFLRCVLRRRVCGIQNPKSDQRRLLLISQGF